PARADRAVARDDTARRHRAAPLPRLPGHQRSVVRPSTGTGGGRVAQGGAEPRRPLHLRPRSTDPGGPDPRRRRPERRTATGGAGVTPLAHFLHLQRGLLLAVPRVGAALPDHGRAVAAR